MKYRQRLPQNHDTSAPFVSRALDDRKTSKLCFALCLRLSEALVSRWLLKGHRTFSWPMADDHRDIREPLARYLKKHDDLRVTMADSSASACRMSGSVQGWRMSDSITSAILVGAVSWR